MFAARNQLERRIVRNSALEVRHRNGSAVSTIRRRETAVCFGVWQRLVDMLHYSRGFSVDFFSWIYFLNENQSSQSIIIIVSWFLAPPLLLAHCALCVLVTICANLALPHATFLAGKVSLRDALNFTPSTNLPIITATCRLLSTLSFPSMSQSMIYSTYTHITYESRFWSYLKPRTFLNATMDIFT